MLQGDQIVALGQDVKACALGQAAASVIGDQIIGLRQETIAIGRDQLQAMLKSHGPVPDAPFNGLEVLLPAREFKNRHASIMLAFEAILGAMEDAKVNG